MRPEHQLEITDGHMPPGASLPAIDPARFVTQSFYDPTAVSTWSRAPGVEPYTRGSAAFETRERIGWAGYRSVLVESPPVLELAPTPVVSVPVELAPVSVPIDSTHLPLAVPVIPSPPEDGLLIDVRTVVTKADRRHRLRAFALAAGVVALGAVVQFGVVMPVEEQATGTSPVVWLKGKITQSKTPQKQTEKDKAAGADAGSSSVNDQWYYPPDKAFYPGPCWNTIVGGLGHHAGMDMNVRRPDVGADAAHDGIVVRRGFDSAAGNYVTIKTVGSRTLYYSYEHLRIIDVKIGQYVYGGKTRIGIIGHTGRMYGVPANGGHLHMTLASSNTLGGYGPDQHATATLNPLSVLPAKAPYGYYCTG